GLDDGLVPAGFREQGRQVGSRARRQVARGYCGCAPGGEVSQVRLVSIPAQDLYGVPELRERRGTLGPCEEVAQTVDVVPGRADHGDADVAPIYGRVVPDHGRD